MTGDGGKPVGELLSAMTPPTNTRERLINTSLELFYRQGFHAVGLDQVIAEVGVTKTTFYNHFESKDELIVEAIKRRDAWEFETWNRRVDELSGGDPYKALLVFFDVLNEWFNHPDFLGCIFVNAAAEFPSPHDPIHQAAANHKRVTIEAIAQLADAAGLTDPDALAEKLMVLLDGAITLRQVTQNNHAAIAAKQIAEMLLKAHEPDEPPSE